MSYKSDQHLLPLLFFKPLRKFSLSFWIIAFLSIFVQYRQITSAIKGPIFLSAVRKSFENTTSSATLTPYQHLELAKPHKQSYCKPSLLLLSPWDEQFLIPLRYDSEDTSFQKTQLPLWLLLFRCCCFAIRVKASIGTLFVPKDLKCFPLFSSHNYPSGWHRTFSVGLGKSCAAW